jgi:hypothetical protein
VDAAEAVTATPHEPAPLLAEGIVGSSAWRLDEQVSDDPWLVLTTLPERHSLTLRKLLWWTYVLFSRITGCITSTSRSA